MKKIILIIILCLSLSGCGIFNMKYFTIPDDSEFRIVVESLDTPKEISEYMLDNFSYKAHLIYAPSPYLLWVGKKGDCNDFACFGTFTANYHGYEIWQIQIWYETTIFSHYLGVYNEGKYSFTDNRWYFYGFNSFKEIVNESGKHTGLEWKNYKVYDYDMKVIEVGEKE